MPSIIIPQNNQILLPAGTTFPKASAEKVARLEMELSDWTTMAGSTVERLRALEEQTISAQQQLSDAKRGQNETAVKQIEAKIEGLMDQRRLLSPVLATRNGRAGELTNIFTRLRAWADKLPAGTRLEAAPEAAIGSKPVTVQRIEALRREIEALEDEQRLVTNAPPAADELKAQIKASVAELAASAGPDLSRFLKGQGSIQAPRHQNRFGVAGAFNFDGEFDVLSLLAWLDPDRLVARLSDEVDAKRKNPAAELTVTNRGSRLAQIEADLLALERQEEALIEAAKTNGQDIARRPHASPLAVLGVVIGKKSFTGGEAMATFGKVA